MEEPNVTIRHYDCIMNTPALPLAVRAWYELLRDGLTDPGAQVVQYDHKGIVALIDDDPLAVLTWGEQAYANQVFVGVAFVLPAFRRQGIHTRMWKELIIKTRALKRPVIVSGAHIKNKGSIAMQRSQGRMDVALLTRFEVPELDETTGQP